MQDLKGEDNSKGTAGSKAAVGGPTGKRQDDNFDKHFAGMPIMPYLNTNVNLPISDKKSVNHTTEMIL